MHSASYIKCYSKCTEMSNTFLFLFSIKMLVFRAEINKMLAFEPIKSLILTV